MYFFSRVCKWIPSVFETLLCERRCHLDALCAIWYIHTIQGKSLIPIVQFWYVEINFEYMLLDPESHEFAWCFFKIKTCRKVFPSRYLAFDFNSLWSTQTQFFVEKFNMSRDSNRWFCISFCRKLYRRGFQQEQIKMCLCCHFFWFGMK